MPFIRISTNCHVTENQEIILKKSIEKALKDILQKAPERMMLLIEDQMHIFMGMVNEQNIPASFVECKFFGGSDYSDFVLFDQQLKQVIHQYLTIEFDHIYIKYEVINGWDEAPVVFKI